MDVFLVFFLAFWLFVWHNLIIDVRALMETSRFRHADSEPGVWWKPGRSGELKILLELQAEREISPVGAPVSQTVIKGAGIFQNECT